MPPITKCVIPADTMADMDFANARKREDGEMLDILAKIIKNLAQ